MSEAGRPATEGWLRALRSDHAHTYAAEGAVMVATLLVYRLAAGLGGEDLDAYILVRRTISFVQPLLMLGLAVGLPRLVAMALEGPRRRFYLLAALRIVVVLSGIGVILAALFPARLASFLLGSAQLEPLVMPLALMVLGLCLHTVAYSYIRGTHHTLVANILQTIGLAVTPLLAFAFTRDLPGILLFTGVMWSGVALLFVLPELVAGPVQVARTERGALLRYGLPRIPGDLAYAALFTFPVLWAAHRWGLAESGRIGLGVTLLNIVAAGFAPISILLLPQTARSISTGDHHGLERRIVRLERSALLVSLAALVSVEAALPWLLDLYLGDVPAAPYVPACRLIFLAAPALAYFVALRSVLDAYHTSPRNGVNIILSLVVAMVTLLVVQLFGLAGPWPGLAVVTGMGFLALSTRYDIAHVRSELRRKVEEGRLPMRLMLVIPGHAEGNEMPFARRQGRWIAVETGAAVETFFLSERTSISGLWRARRRFRKQVRAFRPDIVHAHYGTITGLFTVLVSPVPVVITFHGSDLNPTPTDGRLRDLMGRLFSQLAAFFAAGII
ncbi:MAG: glycosyltransferase, partial [Flavobacteriales bacterium]|nr:glycosyltransferase [Flavobacteriales bacterium]